MSILKRRQILEARTPISQERYLDQFRTEFLRLCKRFKFPEPPEFKGDVSNITGHEVNDTTGKVTINPLHVQVDVHALKMNPVKVARHVFGHYLSELGATDNYGDQVADVIGFLLARGSH